MRDLEEQGGDLCHLQTYSKPERSLGGKTSLHTLMLRTCDEFYAGLHLTNVQLGLVEYLGTYSGFVSCREPRDSTGDLRTVAQRCTRVYLSHFNYSIFP